jgi:ABC-type molybdate transport system substrate-binding protein
VQYLQKFTLTFVHLGMLAMNKVLLLLGAVFMSDLPVWAAEKISVAAAADLNVALTEIVAHYGKQGGNSVEISVPREKH